MSLCLSSEELDRIEDVRLADIAVETGSVASSLEIIGRSDLSLMCASICLVG